MARSVSILMIVCAFFDAASGLSPSKVNILVTCSKYSFLVFIESLSCRKYNLYRQAEPSLEERGHHHFAVLGSASRKGEE